ncbi:MAG: PAS domain S-box protein, partial [Chloroflexota bacterium]
MRYFSFITHAPSFADEDKRRIATILHFILIVTTIANIATILVRPFLLAGQALGPVSANIVILLLQIALFVLMRKGYVRLAGFTLTLFIWTLLSLEAYANNGILNPFFCIQTIVIVIAALLINEWAALGFAVLSSVFGLWLVQLADAGKYVGAVGAITTQVTWMSDTTAFVLTALLFYMRIRSIREVEKRIVEQGRSRQHSDERYRSLVENAPDTIFTLDRNHKITYMNRSTMASVETLIGQSVYDFLHPNSRDAYRAAVNRVLELGSTEQIEVQNLRPGEQSAWYAIRFAPVYEDGQVVEVTAISTNITEQKHVQEALRASEEQYRQLFEANPHPMFVVNLEAGKFLAVNDAAVNQYGYSREEFLTMIVTALRVEEASTIMKQADDLRQQEPSHQSGGIVQHRKKDGSVIWVEMSYHRLNYNGHDAVVSAAHDLTKRLQVEEALRASEEQYRQLFEDNPHPMFVSDAETREMLGVNDAALAMYGYSREEFVGMKTVSLLHPDDYRGATERLQRSKRENLPFIPSTINRFIKKDGSVISVEAVGHQLSYQGRKAILTVAYDLTERLKVEDALRESEARLRARIESAMDAIITIDESQQIVQFNPAAEKMFQVSADDIIGQPIIKLIPERFRPIHGDHIRAFGEAGVTNRRMGALGAISGLRANGEEFPIEASISQFDVGTGKFYSVILRDITERLRAEQALRESEARLKARIESAMDAIITIDESQHIVQFNPAAEKMFQVSADD